MHACQVAGVSQFPRQTDRRVETAFELFDQPGNGRYGRHEPSPVTSIFDWASTASARRYGACCSSSIPAARQAERASGWSERELTTSTIARFFRNDILRVPK